MYQIRTDNEKKNKKKPVALKYEKNNPNNNEEVFECLTCGFKVQKLKF